MKANAATASRPSTIKNQTKKTGFLITKGRLAAAGIGAVPCLAWWSVTFVAPNVAYKILIIMVRTTKRGIAPIEN